MLWLKTATETAPINEKALELLQIRPKDHVSGNVYKILDRRAILLKYVGYEAISSLVYRESPERSVPGILLAVASLIVMPLLARAKREVARNMNSGAMMADAKQTEFCTYLSAILLGGLLINALFGWWWADPVAALVMMPIIAKEGIAALRGDTCCD